MNLDYLYALKTWGGFYNDHHKLIHQQEEGIHYFNSEEEREAYLESLQKISKKLNANMLMYDLFQGIKDSFEMTTLHRVIEYRGQKYYSKYEMALQYPFNAANYHLNYKWTPGFNDYPLGEDFDYSQVTIVQEWITGSFNVEEA